MGLIELKNTGQNTLEICLVIIIGIILLTASVSVWNWFNKSMAERMDAYKATRHVALTTQKGRQINYTPEKLDIFEGISTVGHSGGEEIPDLGNETDLQFCYDIHDAMINQSVTLLEESLNLTLEAGEITTELMDLKTALGNFTVFDFGHIPFSHERFDGWLFNGDYNKFYESSFEVIKPQFVLKSLDPDLAYLKPSVGFISASAIITDYLNVGIGLEDAAEAKATLAADKMNQSEGLSSRAPDFLIECLGGEVPGLDQCKEQCRQDYGEPAKQKNEDANRECFRGNFVLCEQLRNEADELTELYINCTAACGLL